MYHTHLKHDDVTKRKHFPRYWPFVRGIHQSPVNAPHKCQWCGALMFSLICAWINGWENNGEAGVLRRLCAHYDVIVRKDRVQQITAKLWAHFIWSLRRHCNRNFTITNILINPTRAMVLHSFGIQLKTTDATRVFKNCARRWYH